MYKADITEEHIKKIQVLLDSIQARLEQDKQDAAELSWPNIENLKRVVVLLEVVETLWPSPGFDTRRAHPVWAALAKSED